MKMRQILQVVYVLLYLQFFVGDVFTLDIDLRLEEYQRDTNDIKWINSIWECNSDSECTATGSTCKDNECLCTPGYIFNSNMTSCIKVATGLHDSCEETLQCSAYLLGGAECVDNVCVCGSGYYYLHGRCNRYVGLNEKCKQKIDCYVNADFEASTCNMTEKICECSPGFYQREYRTCRREGKAIGDECTIDIDCTVKNAVCQDFVCVEKSESEETTEHLTDMIFTAVTNESMENRVGSNCTSDEDCSELGNAICDLTGTCRCDRAYFTPREDAKCIPELGESCHSDDISGIEKSICRAGIWSCTNGTVASQDNRECRIAITEYREQCYQNEDCYVFGPDAKCEEKMCVCNANSHYVESELFCWGNKGIGETCVQKRDCYVEGFKSELVCKDSTCDCPDGTYLNKNMTNCISTTAGIGEACEVNEDCDTNNAICNEEVCECEENYYPSKSKSRCLAGLNTICEEDKQCIPANSKCISEFCSCKPNYVPVGVNLCLPVLSYGESCLQDIQCSTTVPGAMCSSEQDAEETADKMELSNVQAAGNKICTCDQEDHYRFGKCFKKKLLRESCTNIGECYLNFNLNSVMCMNGKCTCNWDYVKLNDSACVKNTQAVRFPNGGVINVVSTGLFSVVLLLASCDIF